ncbi:MAG TPA: hypothetical protein VMZ53_06155 [Kofleriaceae bacterium]|nr:hypothetical protein [Kofleriaceae bacterium]
MAHKSHKKHIKHLHQHEPATPKAKSPVAKAEAAQARVAKSRTANGPAKAEKAGKKAGLVRKLARTATKTVAAKPKKIISRARARVENVVKARVEGAKARVEGAAGKVSARVKSLIGVA